MGLKLENISYSVSLRNGDIDEIIKDFSLEVRPGEIVTLFGKSGCGKTTILNIVSGLQKPTTGRIRYNSHDFSQPSEDIAFVFQEPALFPFRTVQSNVEFGLEVKGIKGEEKRKRSDHVLKKVGIYEHRNKYPAKDKLSGGMKQRVEIAGVLADQSPVILMDEPFSALDDITREEMQAFVLRIWQEFNKTILFVTHNKDEAVLLSDRIVMLPPSPRHGEPKIVKVDIPRPRNPIGVDFLHYKEILSEHLKQ